MKTIYRILAAFLLFLTALPTISAETRLFVMGYVGDQPVDRAGFYVVPVSDPDWIAKLRQSIRIWKSGGIEALIAENASSRVSANVEFVGDGINRDYSRPGAPAWTWRVSLVTEVFGWEYVIAVGLDGSPACVELRACGWYNPYLDVVQIAFGNYGPIGELPVSYDPALGSGPKTSWIGDFSDEHYPWIFHQSLGWLYVTGFDPGHVWIWSIEGQRRIWTREGSFPWLWDETSGSWKYLVEVGNTPYFYNLSNQTWEAGF